MIRSKVNTKLGGRFFASLLIGLCVIGALAGSAHAGEPAKYGLESVGASLSTTQAGAHPDFTTSIELKTDPAGPTKAGLNPPFARTRDLSVSIPPGLLGNPANFPQCTVLQLEEDACPIASQIGITEVSVYTLSTFVEPVYLMNPPPGSAGVVARIGFVADVFPEVLNVRVKPETDYGIEAKLEGANASAQLVRAVTTLWGVPTDPIHDPQRVTPQEASNGELPPGGGRESGLRPTAFMTNPTRCGALQEVTVSTDSYQLPGVVSTMSAPLPSITGCGQLSFAPQFSLSPTTSSADSPSGIDATLALSQQGLIDPGLLASAHLKKAVVALPQGMTLNAAAATGLGACSEAQIGLISESPIRFDSAPATCSTSAKVGTVEIKTPVLPEPIQGSLYIASQGANPFHTLLAGYLSAEGEGVIVKLAGRFEVDSATGQITAVFDENPQQPFEDLELHFKGGPHGVLTTPDACGRYTIDSVLSPWSAVDPFAPLPSEVAESASTFPIVSGPNGGGCPNGALSAELSAGTVNPTAGAYSPFAMRLTRPDGTPRLRGLELSLPTGLIGKLAGIPYCPDAAIGAAASRSQPGQGAEELASPSCPAASQIGTVTAGVGSGPSPFFVSTGKVYLAGPYKGAPLSLAIVTPAVAGPFDLGDVVVRAALNVDPLTARIKAVSDPLPTILEGIPLDLRDIRVNLDRPNFTLNPTSCAPKLFEGSALADSGVSAPLSERFQAASCASLGFKPNLKLSLTGATKRAGHPALKAVLTYPKKGSYANIAAAQVSLPHSEFLDQGNLNKVCTQPELRSQTCPKTSIYGRAKVWTPLLDKPLQGPIYLGVGFGYKLPALVAELNGQLRVLLVGKVDTDAQQGIRNTFKAVPDAPVSRFELTLKGGKKYGLLENSEDICRKAQKAAVQFNAQNGKVDQGKIPIGNSCKKHGKKHTSHR
jgi:hypothetical protein